MSCLDVMYQVFGPQPYFSSYSPYHHQKLALYSKMQDPQESSSRQLPPPGPPGPPAIKEEDKDLPPGAEYLGARCVLFSYFQGDISSVVDEHFSRALSQTAAYPPPSSHKALRDGSFPMSQRSFPPSFWNSSSSLSAPHPDLSFPGDPYSSHLHQPNPESWHHPPPPPPPHHPPHHHHHHHPYSLGGALGAQGSAYRAPHEVYGPAFDPRYGSLLLPSVRTHPRLAPPAREAPGGAAGAPCDPGQKGEAGAVATAWSGAFTGAGAEIGLNMDTGLQAQDKSKDLYWF
ncbi:LOW QUALITY PROTEIN: transcription cofactor vestigial-like protein 2a [Menidia menidia]